MDVTNYTIKQIIFSGWTESPSTDRITSVQKVPSSKKFRPFQWLRNSLDGMTISDRQLAHKLCQLIPAQCPFARDIKLFGKTLISIPPLCKLNPFYEELMGLRWRALCYLADECGEDISVYC